MALDLLEQILPSIKDSVYRQKLSLDDWKMKEGEVENGASTSLNDKGWTSIRVPFQWGKFDKTYWFRQTVEVPPSLAGQSLALVLDFPEALLFLNGKPYQGLDKNHTEVILTARARSMEPFHIAIEAYSGRTKDHHSFSTADLVVIDTTARKLYHSLNALRDLEHLAERGSKESKDLHEIIRRTLVYLKYFAPGSEAYPEQIRRAYDEMLKMLETEFRSTLPGLIHLIGHSHIDVAWLWTFRETIRKCGRTFSSALRLLDEYPDFKFSQSQAVLYEYTRENYPDLFRQIKQRVTEGRWEVMGSTWVEPDCNIPNGESLVRQIVYGKRYFKQEFNIDSDILWLPDTFGYSWAMPQILKKAGINYFSTTKLTWNDTNKFPYESFWWEGIDGTRILSHIPPVGLEGQTSPKDLEKSSTALQPESPTPHVMQTVGFGDGGGGVTKENIEIAAVLKGIAGLPVSQFSTVRDFFLQASQQATAEFPVWKSELYLEKHRGTLTTHGWIKKANRTSETALYTAELLATMASLWGKASSRKYPKQELEALWKTLLLYQFHDIVPGTSIKDVYTEVRAGFEDIRKRASVVTDRALASLQAPSKKSEKELSFTVFNPLQHERAEYVELTFKTKDRNIAVKDGAGKSIESQILEHSGNTLRVLCYVPVIPPFGSVVLHIRSAEVRAHPHEPWKASKSSFETPIHRARLDGKGGFSSIYDKTIRRELIQKGKRGNLFLTYRDSPKQWDAWDIDADYDKHRLDLLEYKGFRVLEHGPLRMTIRLEFRTPNNSTIHQDVRFYHKRNRVDFDTHVKWNESQTLLKVAFPLTVKSAHATYEIQFGALRRPTKSHDPWEKAKFEVPAQQWADISEQKYGISLLNDSKYAYDAKESTLRLTLLRSPHYPHPTEPWHLFDKEITDAGEHRFVYSLQPHSGDWRTGASVRRARELNVPVLLVADAAFSIPAPIVVASKPNVFIDAIKIADESDAVIVRLHEGHGESVDTTLQFAFECKEAAECDLLEQDVKELKASKHKLAIKLKPYEIKTLRIVPKIKR